MPVGWLKTLLLRSLLRRRRMTQQPIKAAIKKKAPRSDPTTIPAIWPPLRPWLSDATGMVPLPVAVGLPEEVEEGNSGGIEVVVGKWTFVHRDSARALAQHESVPFGELFAQYEQSPAKFERYPQSFGSFKTPVIQVPLSESAGKAQLVKSARIWLIALGPERPHSSGLAAMVCSLMANSAHVSAHSGRDALPEREHACTEF